MIILLNNILSSSILRGIEKERAAVRVDVRLQNKFLNNLLALLEIQVVAKAISGYIDETGEFIEK